jgi:hypothetical protein
VYVTPEGQDLSQLLEKFIRGAVNFSQGSDDYLDDDTEDKGLLTSHAQGDSAYTDLEHAWDEGFGYFGAARNYGDWTDVDIADVGHMDVDGDGSIDLLTEVNWGHSINAAKRDKGAVAATDFTQQAWDGFYGGRQLLSETAGTDLTDTQLDELRAFRDDAVAGWENGISATCVHYINDVLQDMAVMDDDSTYSFANHAQHWSELKGFALGLQFNPTSPLSDEDFTHLHTLIGDAPVLGDASATDQADYADALIEARGVLMDAYGFDGANAGDGNGENGW